MPNQLDGMGLKVKSYTEIVNAIVADLQTIYGSDINVSQNSPDGQLINIFAQADVDMLDLLVSVYNSFSVLTAFGVLLDQRIALNGLARKQGTFTLTNVSITTSQALTLAGLDAAINDPNGTGFTVADNAGNQFILTATTVIAAPGTYVLPFRAKAIGAVQTLPNTITNQVTVVLGVTGVNNPSTATSVGVDEESDSALKIRHAQSFFLAASGPADSVQAALQAIANVTDSLVLENTTGGTVNGIPAHSIWCIVENGADADVAQSIYAKKAPGCGMLGSVSVVVTRPNGQTTTIKFDRPVSQNLWIRFTIVPRVAGATFDNNAIKTALVAAIIYRIAQAATIGDPVQAMATIAPLAILTSVGVSTDGANYFDIVQTTTSQYKFALDVSRITIS